MRRRREELQITNYELQIVCSFKSGCHSERPTGVEESVLFFGETDPSARLCLAQDDRGGGEGVFYDRTTPPSTCSVDTSPTRGGKASITVRMTEVLCNYQLSTIPGVWIWIGRISRKLPKRKRIGYCWRGCGIK